VSAEEWFLRGWRKQLPWLLAHRVCSAYTVDFVVRDTAYGSAGELPVVVDDAVLFWLNVQPTAVYPLTDRGAAPATPWQELAGEIASLKQELAQREHEVDRLRQAIAACCPWWDRRWHQPH
jgi:hypothetical protein